MSDISDVEPVTIRVLGTPAPQGSKRAFVYNPKGGGPVKAGMVESSHDRVKSWRQAIVDAAQSALDAGGCTCDHPDTGAERIHRPFCGILPPLTGPLEVSMVFRMPRPKGHYRTGRNAHLLRDSAPFLPASKPDLSKLCRSTEDALTDAGVWGDDAQVVRYDVLAKIYAGVTGLPGVTVTIWQLDKGESNVIPAACTSRA